MHENARLLETFYKSLQADDHRAVAACYHCAATFEDIAFKLPNKKMIHAMWHMITEADLRLTYYTIESADDGHGSARWTAKYTFKDTGRKVHNELRSTFFFEDGRIIRQRDECNPWRWGMQALGPVRGTVSALFPAKRREQAMCKLQAFIDQHPEYQSGRDRPAAAKVA